jgi:hypothetical protein
MGKSERSSGYGETQTHHVGISPQEDRGGTAGTVGEGQSGKEVRMRRHSFLKSSTIAMLSDTW